MSLRMNTKNETGMTEPRLAILVLTYNHAKYIEQCLLSVLAIDFPDMHIWVLDDGSTDYTADIVRQLEGATGRITLLTQQHSNGRTAENIQRLVDLSKSQYIMFMSGDDLLGPAFPVTKSIKTMEQDPLIGLVLPRTIAFNQSPTRHAPIMYDEIFLRALQSGDPKRICSEHLYRRVSAIFLQGMIVRRALVDETGGFDVDLTADDYAFICRLFFLMAKTEWKFSFFPDHFWLYRNHDNNVHKNSIRQIKAISETVGKYIPSEYWKDFAWHVPPVTKAVDLPEVEKTLLRNLNGNQASQTLQRVIKKSIESWFRTGNYAETRNLMQLTQFETIKRTTLVKLFVRALPIILIYPVLRMAFFSSAVHRLSDALRRR